MDQPLTASAHRRRSRQDLKPSLFRSFMCRAGTVTAVLEGVGDCIHPSARKVGAVPFSSPVRLVPIIYLWR